MAEQDLNTVLNFKVNGLKVLDHVNTLLEQQGLRFEDLAKSMVYMNEKAQITSAQLKAIAKDGKEVGVVVQRVKNKTKNVFVNYVKETTLASEATSRLSKQLKALQAVKMPQLKGGTSGSSAMDYQKLAVYLRKLQAAQRDYRDSSVDTPGAKYARQLRLRYIQDEINKTKQLIQIKKEDLQIEGVRALKQAESAAQQQKLNNQMLSLNKVAVPQGPAGSTGSLVADYQQLKKYIEELNQAQRNFKALSVDAPGAQNAKALRLKYIQEEIVKTKQLLQLKKEELRVEGARALKQASDAANQQRLKQQIQSLRSIKMPQMRDASSGSSALDYLRLQKYLEKLNQTQRDYRSLSVDTPGAKYARQMRLRYIQDEITKAKQLLQVKKEEIRLEIEKASKQAEGAAIQQKLKFFATDLQSTMNRPGFQGSGNAAQQYIQRQAYLEKEVAIKKTLVDYEKQLAVIAKSKHLRPDQVNQVRILQQTIALLKQEAAANITNAKAAQQAALAHKGMLKDADQHKEVWLNLTNAFRVMQFIVLHRVFFGIAQGIAEGAKAAVEFSIRIGEIRTISDRAKTSTLQWEAAIRSLSEAFGQDLLTTSRGIYEAISNQVVKSAQDIQFFTENMKLAKVTVSTFEDAINATTAIINAFGMSTAKTAEIAGVLFKTVDIGRVRLNEMANTIGRVSVLSDALGVSFEEQQAALAALSIQGVKHHTAETYLINIYQKLIRPSDRLKEIYEEWGVSSGEMAIRTFDVVGVLERLEQIAEDSGDEMAEFGNIFQRIRATTGATALSTEKMADALGKMKNSTKDARDAYNEMYNTMGARAERQLQKIKNMFTADFGKIFAEQLVSVGESFGSLNTIIIYSMSLLAGITTAWLVFRNTVNLTNFVLQGFHAKQLAAIQAQQLGAEAVAALNAKTLIYATTLSWLSAGLSALIGLFVLYKTQQASMRFVIEENIRVTSEQARRNRENLDLYKGLEKAVDSYSESMKNSIQVALSYIAAFVREINRQQKIIAAQLEFVEDATVAVMDNAKESAKNTVEAIADVIKAMEEDVKESFDNINNMALNQGETVFNQTLRLLGFWGEEAADVMSNRAVEIGQQLKNIEQIFFASVSGVFGKKGKKIAKEAMEQYQALSNELVIVKNNLKQADELAKSELQNQIGFATKQGENLLNSGLAALAGAQTPEQAELANKQIALAEKMLAKRNELVDQYIEKYETNVIAAQQRINFMQNQELEIINRKVLAEQQHIAIMQQRAEAEKARLADQEALYKQLEFAFGQIKKLDYKDDNQAIFTQYKEQIDSITKQLGMSFKDRFDLMRQLEADYLKQSEKAQLDVVENVAKQTAAAAKDITLVRESMEKKLLDTENKQREANEASLKGLSEFAERIKSTIDASADFFGYGSNAIEIIRQNLAAYREGTYPERSVLPGSSIQEAENIVRKYDEFKELYQKLIQGGLTPQQTIDAYKQLVYLSTSLQRMGILDPVAGRRDAQDLSTTIEALTKANQEYLQTVQIFQTQVEPLYKDIIQFSDDIKNSTAAELQMQFQIVQLMWEKLELLKAQARVIVGNIPGEGMALGGTRGNDRRIVAMDPREFIVNAEASRTYRPILQAINAGRLPHFSGGGSVTNVGDIRVTVNGGETSTQTIHDIANGINREIRLGRIKLNV